jgi:predicted RNase H-like HicB family nuclease
MLTEYILKKLAQAKYKILADGMYFGEIPGLKGVWATEKTLEKCQRELREVLEDWLILKLRDDDKIPDWQTKTKKEHKLIIAPGFAYA